MTVFWGSTLILLLCLNAGLLFLLLQARRRNRRHGQAIADGIHRYQDAESRLAQALAGADLGWWEWDMVEDRILFNVVGLHMLGYQRDEIGLPMEKWQSLLHPEDLARRNDTLKAYLHGQSERYECEYRIRHRDGRWIWILDRGKLLSFDAHGQATRMVGTFLDIDRRKAMELELLQHANTDALTGLANRRVFMDRLRQEWMHQKRQSGLRAVVVMCDIDHFKKINDGYGHEAGDLALQHFARLLATHTRENDLAARLGGEEFAVILEDAGEEDAYHWAERLRTAIARSAVVLAEGSSLNFTICLGICTISADAASPEVCLRNADRALYQAKKSGRNQSSIHGQNEAKSPAATYLPADKEHAT